MVVSDVAILCNVVRSAQCAEGVSTSGNKKVLKSVNQLQISSTKSHQRFLESSLQKKEQKNDIDKERCQLSKRGQTQAKSKGL